MLAWSTLALVLVGCVAGTDEEPEHPRLLPVVGAESLREGISGHDGPVLVDYWARACPPCLRLAPVLRELVEEREDLLVLKVDMGRSENRAAFSHVSHVPRIEIYREGRKVRESVGFQSAEELRASIESSGE